MSLGSVGEILLNKIFDSGLLGLNDEAKDYLKRAMSIQVEVGEDLEQRTLYFGDLIFGPRIVNPAFQTKIMLYVNLENLPTDFELLHSNGNRINPASLPIRPGSTIRNATFKIGQFDFLFGFVDGSFYAADVTELFE